MDPTTAIVLNTFRDTATADMAASQLRSHGIECLITTDDCGGMFPPLGVIKLLVAPAEARDAREILQLAPVDTEPAATGSQNQSASSTNRNGPPPRVYRFNSGVAVGLILGALLHFAYTHYQANRDRTDRYYYDDDDQPDQEVISRNGQMIESRFDRDGDGRWDWWTHYKDGVPTSEETDENFDGRADGWYALSPKGLSSTGRVDSDFNGVPDVFMTCEHGQLKQSDWRPNGTNVILLRQVYQHGELQEEIRDTDGDGRFDVSVRFDAFSTPISTNYFVVPVRPAL